MKHQMAMTKNMRRFLNVVDELMNRPPGTEGMGLLWGKPGQGKSTSVAYACNAMDGVFVRAIGSWTVTSMLGEISVELGGKRQLRRADMIHYIVEQLAANPRPVFIDEADYLFQQVQMIDSLRDIYDLSRAPVILIGMEDIARTLQNNGRFARRITQWVEFEGIDLADARIVADTCCEVGIDDDLLRYIHDESSGNIGRQIVALTKVERMAKASGLASVGRDDWGDRTLFYDQPVFSSRKSKRGE
ncbi:MAG: AAA family ATPase [Desulfuromonas sp.]|nr:MAG: AAA family ATPase [Desulfuromonas sp.]